MAFESYHPYIADGDFNGWIETLDDILKMNANTTIPGHGTVSGKKDIADMKEYLIIFYKESAELCAKSTDVDYIVSGIRKSVPPRAEGDSLIKANIQGRYLKKSYTAH